MSNAFIRRMKLSLIKLSKDTSDFIKRHKHLISIIVTSSNNNLELQTLCLCGMRKNSAL